MRSPGMDLTERINGYVDRDMVPPLVSTDGTQELSLEVHDGIWKSYPELG